MLITLNVCIAVCCGNFAVKYKQLESKAPPMCPSYENCCYNWEYRVTIIFIARKKGTVNYLFGVLGVFVHINCPKRSRIQMFSVLIVLKLHSLLYLSFFDGFNHA